MIIGEILNDCRLFRLSPVLYKDVVQREHKIRKLSPDECQMRRQHFERQYYENGKPIQLVKIMAEKGLLNGYFSNKCLKTAQKQGILPEGYQIHHIIPIKLGGSDELSNLCLVEEKTHAYLHKFIYQQILNLLADGDEGIVVLPPFKPVIHLEDRTSFLLYAELRAVEKEERVAHCVGRHKKSWENLNADMGRRDAFSRSVYC